ncbi:hypothetical protein SJ05684_b42190 (plasmid) [Sinorhizobium sojae CCBAU 05684]|uniref:Uncharacterized protein n=1 Tax=Sinorhizobium sojae CCBAU 05684 TaxID=716928 RepID=A0A249PH02_9HYPH|nr:hypothetical protein [Sinorhizobium sojae]ASY65201.1 hypothetical protein SJ05684_b42190 [Sinorhizobium sojae CCBAU 05684]
MSHAEQVIERAMAAVAAARLRRERELERRRQTFGRIELTPPLPMPRRGLQLSLQLSRPTPEEGTVGR